MILCVTLNPCLDKTLVVPAWQPGDSVRGQEMAEVVGGKGNNVARALNRLGRAVQPVTFLGGPIGQRCSELLRQTDRFDPIVTPTAAPTRIILTVRTQGTSEQTAFFDPDPAITSDEAEDLFHRVEGALTAGEVEALTLSGSSPSESTHGLYLDLIALSRTRKIPVFLDTYGPALDQIWGFWPDVIQLNRREAAAHLQTKNLSNAEVFALLDAWGRHGVRLCLVTDGPRPALIRAEGRQLLASPPSVEVVNPIGSGDCLLAGLVDAWMAGRPTLEVLQHGIACAAANAEVWDAGAIDPNEVQRLKPEVQIEPWQPGGNT